MPKKKTPTQKERIAELEGEVELLKVSLDESAKKYQALQSGISDTSRDYVSVFCRYILEGDGSVNFSSDEWPARLQIEWRAMKARIAEAEAHGWSHDLFGELAGSIAWMERAKEVQKEIEKLKTIAELEGDKE